MYIKNFEMIMDGGDYIQVYDTKTNELVYEDEWTSEDFDIWAKMAAIEGVSFTDYLAKVIEDNIEAIKELEEE